MRVSIIAVGKLKASPEKDLLQKYLTQTPWQISLIEIEAKKNLAEKQRIEAEAREIMAACANHPIIVALDEKGVSMSTTALADKFTQWQNNAMLPIAFVIGGADGLHPTIRERAALMLNFGAMTWPHMLVRAMLAEQLYRIHTLLNGHPYHRNG